MSLHDEEIKFKYETVKTLKGFIRFVTSFHPNWNECWKDETKLKNFLNIFGQPKKYPCKVMAQYKASDDPESYKMGYKGSWQFGIEKNVRTFVPFKDRL